MAPQKTFWHLQQQRRVPTEYELATSKLHCYMGEGFTGRKFELDVPLAQWYKQYQEGSPLACDAWGEFQDPRATTYAAYVRSHLAKEQFVDELLEEIETTGYDKGLSPDWVRELGRTVAPLRYPFHGLQMLAAYVAQMAPDSRITVAATLQAADELRRVQRIAYRVGLLQLTHPGFAEDSKSLWQTDPMWQPLRRLIERLLVAYDWGEAFVGLNLVLKPLVDELFMRHVGELAADRGDYMLGRMFYSLDQDCQWHRQWSAALVDVAIRRNPENRRSIGAWIDKWLPDAEQAVLAFEQPFGTPQRFAETLQRLREHHREHLRALGLQG